MDKHFVRYTNDVSIEEIQQMIEDIEVVIYHIEKMNEVLSEKMTKNHPIFTSLIKALLISNCNAVKATLQIKSLLDKKMDDFFMKSKPNMTE